MKQKWIHWATAYALIGNHDDDLFSLFLTSFFFLFFIIIYSSLFYLLY